MSDATYVPKACAYITRPSGELLVFEGPDHDGLQIPKGTLEPAESPRAACLREVAEETGLVGLNGLRHLVTDVWTRRPGRHYIRHFFHARVHDAREQWTHVVRDGGEEDGSRFECRWIRPSTAHSFALDLDAYLTLVPTVDSQADSGALSD